MRTTVEQLADVQYSVSNKDQNFDTLALHAGAIADPTTGALLTPIYQTTTYRQEAVGKDKGFTYSRSANPTVSALERRLAAIEGASYCTCYATGLAATTALCLALLREGDHVVASQAVYGGTVRLFNQVLAPFGVTADFVDTANEADLRKAVTARPTRFVFIETPANPTLRLTDIELTARIAHEANALLVVDNTLLTPALHRPARALFLHSQRDRRNPIPISCVVDAARRKDCRVANGTALRKRFTDCSFFRNTSSSDKTALSGPGVVPAI
jgi:cystathionine beta-lyase/cystathionine gamma-synthase